MSYDPKWIRDDAVVKRDGTNDLTGDWDIGNQIRIVLDELQMRDASGLTISDTTGNILVSIDNQTGLFSLKQGTGINAFSTDTSLAANSDFVVPTQSAIKTYVDVSIAASSGSPESIFYGGDSTEARATAVIDGIEFGDGTQIGELGYSGATMILKNTEISGYFGLHATNSTGATRILANMNPNGNVQFYNPVSNTIAFTTIDYGAQIGGANGNMYLYFSSSGVAEWKNQEDNGTMRIIGQISTNVDKTIFVGNPAGAAELYHAGVINIRTASTGFSMLSGGTDAAMYFENVSDVVVATFQTAAGALYIDVPATDNNINFRTHNGSTDEYLATFDGGGACSLYHDGSKVFNTRIGGWQVYNGANSCDIYMDPSNLTIYNNVTSGGFIAQVKNGSGTSQNGIVCTGGGSTSIYNAGVSSLTTTAAGLMLRSAGTNVDFMEIQRLGDLVNFYIPQNGFPVQIRGLSDVGGARNLFYADPEGAAELYCAGNKVFSTLYESSGGVGNNMGFYIGTHDGTECMWAVSPDDNWSFLRSNNMVFYLDAFTYPRTDPNDMYLRTSGVAGAVQTHIKLTGLDGSTNLYFGNVSKFATTAAGVYIGDGTASGLKIFYTTDDIYMDNSDPGGNLYIRNRNAANDAYHICLAGISDGETRLYYAGLVTAKTHSTGFTLQGTGTAAMDVLFLDNLTAAATGNYSILDFRQMTSTQIRVSSRITSRFTTTTDATRTAEMAIQILNSGAFVNAISAVGAGGVSLYHAGVLKFYTNSSGATVVGTLVADGVTVGTSENIYIGTGGIVHDGTNLRMTTTDGKIQLRYYNAGFSEMLEATPGGAVDLYYNNVLKAATLDDGFTIAGCLTLDEITTPTADANHGKIYTKTDDKLYFQDGAGAEHQIAFVP